MSTAIDSVGLILPEDWVRFPLESGEFEQFAKNQRNLLKEKLDLNRTAQRRYELMLQALRNDLRRDNVRMVASLAKEIPAEEVGEGSGDSLLLASCIISKLNKADVGGDVPLTVNTMLVGMSRGPKIDESDEFTKRIDDLEAPEVVEMPAGEAVRLIRLHEMRSITQPDKAIELFVQHFLMPLDSTGDNAVIVTFSSPSLEYARPMSDLFSAIMTTFRKFSGDDDLTDPLATPSDA